MVRSLEGLLERMLETGGDKDGRVRETVSSSLVTIGLHQHSLFFQTTHAYLARQPKLPVSHRKLILTAMEAVSSQVLDCFDENLIGMIVSLGVQELTATKDVVEEWQGSASALLVTLSRRYCQLVMDSVLQKLQPGFVPHPYTLYTLGSVAVANAFGFIPFLSDVMSRIVPMLSSAKTDAIKRAFATALRQFCESLLEYVSNIDESPDSSVTKEVYATQISAAYEVLLLHWLSAKDTKLKVAVIECLGEMCHVIPAQKLHEELRRIIPAIIGLYKKTNDPYPITKGLSRLLEAAVLDESCPLEPYLEEIWVAIFPQVCEEVDYNNSSSLKNQNEVFRCFHVSVTRYSDKLVYYLLQKIQSNSEKHKIGGLCVLRHLLNSSGPFMEDKRSIIILGLKPVLTDYTSIKVKRVLCQLSVALADHNYLEADGGGLVVEFLVKNLVSFEEIHGKKTQEDPFSVQQIRLQCSQTLFTMASNIPSTQKFLWPYLLEFICVESAAPVLYDFYRSIHVVAQRMNENKELKADSILADSNPKIPGPHQILSRVLVSSVGPIGSNRKQCYLALKMLKELSVVFHPSLPAVIPSEVINKSRPEVLAMETLLDEAGLTQEEWETRLLKFTATIVIAVSDGEWRADLAAALGKQFHLYNNHIDEKQFLYRCLGGVLAKITDRQFVVDHLDLMFRAVNPGSSKERQGCGRGVGYCAHVHSDIVLTKLENVAKWEHQKKTGGFFGFLKDQIPVKTEVDGEIALLRSNIMLCYGYVLYYCNTDTVTQRLDGTVLRFLKPYMDAPKDTIVIESLLQTFDLIAATVHPEHLKADYTFTSRDTLLNHLKEYVKTEQNDVMNTKIRYLACKAAASLVKLDPPLSETEVWGLSTVLGHHVYPLTTAKDPEKLLDSPEIISSTLKELHSVYEEIIRKDGTSATSMTIIKVIQPWFPSPSNVERERALRSALLILKSYYTHATDISLGHAKEFSLMGSLFGRFSPRLCDSVGAIRTLSLECVRWVLALCTLHRGHGKDHTDLTVDAVMENKHTLEEDDLQGHLMVVVKLSKIIEQKLPPKQVQTYLTALFDMILDKQPGVSTAAALMLKTALNERGPQLQTEAEKIVETILAKLGEMNQLQTYAESLQAFHQFTHHHQSLVLNILLSQTLPLSQGVVDCWHTLARDGTILHAMIDRVLESVDEGQAKPWDTPDGSNIRFANVVGLQGISAFIEIIKGGEPENIIQSAFPRLLSSVLLHVGCFVNTNFPMNRKDVAPEMRKIYASPGALAHNAVKTLLLRARTDMLMHHLTEVGAWKDFEDPVHYPFAVAELAKAVGVHYSKWVKPLSDIMQAYLDHPEVHVEPKRVVAAAVLSSFIKLCPGGDSGDATRTELLEVLVSSMMKGIADPSLHVRKLCVRGMGNVAHFTEEELGLYSTTALSAMMAGLEDAGDHKDEIALEAMQGLTKLSPRVPRPQIEQILTSVLLRIRPCFDKGSGALRSVAFNLFSELSIFGHCEVYREQIHSNITALLLHLNDEEEEVRKACVSAINAVGPLLKMESIANVVDQHFSENSAPVQYSEFLREISKALIDEFRDKLNFYALSCSNYYKSSSSRIRANAVLLTGYLLGNAPSDLRPTVSKDLIFGDLSLLLQDPEVEVRVSAAEAVSCLHAY